MNQINYFITLALSCLILLSCTDQPCGSESLDEKKISSEKTNSKEGHPVSRLAAKALPTQKVVQDTTPSPKQGPRVMIDPARPKSKIKATFPFDIPLTNADKKALNSETVLQSNGKPTIVLFWLTTCYPCRIEMAAMKKAYPDWVKEADFNMVGISTDFEKNYDNFIKMVKKEQWPWTTVHDTNREFRKVIPGGLNGLPQSFIFDKDGNIVYHNRKYSTGDEHHLFDIVKKLAGDKK